MTALAPRQFFVSWYYKLQIGGQYINKAASRCVLAPGNEITMVSQYIVQFWPSLVLNAIMKAILF